MKPLPKEARAQNIHGDAVCNYCVEGQVVVTAPEGGYGEGYGPCPFCEKGLRLEFSGVWDSDGFWQGREVLDLQPVQTGPRKLIAPPRWPVLTKDMPE